MFNYINFDNEKIKNNINELKKLPDEIYNKIKINKELYGLSRDSNFVNIVNNIKCNKLEDIIKSGCIKDKSIYEKGEKIIINGLNCIKLKKGLKIYRFNTGFLTNDKIEKLLYDRQLSIFVLYSKYLAYSYARLCFGGIICYELVNDIILLDLFNYNNLKFIIKEFNKHIELTTNSEYLQYITNMKDYLIYMTGIDVSLNEQIIYYNKIYDRSHIFVYEKVNINNYNHIYKNIYYEEDVNIIDLKKEDTPYMYRYLNLILIIVLNNYINIDGIIIKQIFTQLSDNGVYDNEQIIMKPESQLKNLKYNKKSKLNWENWKIKDFDINKYKNTIIQLYYLNKYNGSISYNNNFELLKYYYKYQLNYNNIENQISKIYDNNKKYILLYDINNLFYLNNLYFYDLVINKIIKFIKKINNLTNNNLEMIFLYNSKTFFKYYIDVIKLRLNKINYNYIYNNNNILILKNNNNINIENLNINIEIDNNVLEYFNYPYFDINKTIKSRKKDNEIYIIYYNKKKIIFYNFFIYLINYYNIPLNDKAIEYIKKINIDMIKQQINILLKYKFDILFSNTLIIYNNDEKKIFEENGYVLVKSINNINNKKIDYSDFNTNINIYSHIKLDDNIYIEYSNLFKNLPLLQSI